MVSPHGVGACGPASCIFAQENGAVLQAAHANILVPSTILYSPSGVLAPPVSGKSCLILSDDDDLLSLVIVVSKDNAWVWSCQSRKTVCLIRHRTV